MVVMVVIILVKGVIIWFVVGIICCLNFSNLYKWIVFVRVVILIIWCLIGVIMGINELMIIGIFFIFLFYKLVIICI